MKFKTYSSIFLNRFEALNLSLMQKMQNRRAVPQGSVTDTKGDAAGAAVQETAAAATPITTGAAASGGVKKKKPKKKK